MKTLHQWFPRAPVRALCLLGLAAAGGVRAAAAQDSARVVAGARYKAGGLHRLVNGSGYRDLWATPMEVQVLDPDTFAGGLTVEKEGGGFSTESLRLKGRNGREYVFRSVDKNVTPGMPKDLHGTIPAWVVQDLVSAKNPAAALVADPLLSAAGVLHASPRLYVMPDHAFLGEFRHTFAGRLGLVEVRPTDGFADSRDVKGSDDVRKKIEASPADRVDQRAFLTARLMDVYLGDWDRHWDQWRWARRDSAGVTWWEPIPRDRDNAFNDNRGLISSVARGFVHFLVTFGPEYASVERYHRHPAELDRLLLTSLSRAEWDSTATWLRSRLTDDVIQAAARRLPPEYQPRERDRLAAALRARRDALPEIAREFYELMAREPDVHTTDAAERAEITRLPDGGVDVVVHAPGDAAGHPYFRRRFARGETREVRVYLHGGDDQTVVRGASPGGAVLVRVIGGGGDDKFLDESSAGGGRRTVFYDDRGSNEFAPGREAKVDEHSFTLTQGAALIGNAPPPRDWGAGSSLFVPWATWQLNVGPVIGVGPKWTRYGFRRQPHAESLWLRGLYAPFESGFGVEGHYDRHITNRPAFVAFDARGTDFEVVRFHGFGNDSPDDPDRDAYEGQTQVRASIAYVAMPARGLTLSFGPVAKWTDPDRPAALPLAQHTLGDERFTQAGAQASAMLDRRDTVALPRHGFTLRASAAGYGSELGGPFGCAEGEATGYASVPGSFGPTVALRAGAQKALGDFPFQESAFVGGPMNLRGFPYQRFRGDAAVYGSAELRARLFYANLGVVRAHVGVFGLADAGRVYVDGDSPGGWHVGKGGGLWFQSLHRTASVVFAHGETNSFYLTVGMPF